MKLHIFIIKAWDKVGTNIKLLTVFSLFPLSAKINEWHSQKNFRLYR